MATNPSVFSPLHNHASVNRILNERTKRGLFSSIAGLATGTLSSGNNKEPEEEIIAPLKPKPYDFNEVEMTAIQAMVSIRDIIGELLQKVGFNMPSLASLITRSENGADKTTALSQLSDSSSSPLNSLTATKSTNVGVQVLRGLALSLPFIIPMATQLRRMSIDTPSVASIPLTQVPQMMIPDIYYNQAMHRRRGKRSLNSQQTAAMIVPLFRDSEAMSHLLDSRPILSYLQQMKTKYATRRK